MAVKSLNMFALVAVVVFGFSACGLTKQRNAVHDARDAVAFAGAGVDVGEKAAAEYFEDFPPEDTEHYCKEEITLFAFNRVIDVLELAEDSIKLWEISIATYEANKMNGGDPDEDEILSSQAEWLIIAADVLGVLNYAMITMEAFGVDVPLPVTYAWEMIYGFVGEGTEPTEVDIDWGEIEDSVCEEWIP